MDENNIKSFDSNTPPDIFAGTLLEKSGVIVPGIGKTINEKFQEYMKTGTLKVLERSKTDPILNLQRFMGLDTKQQKN